MLALADKLDGALVVVGNAPTALLALLDLVDAGRCRPALVIGTPVGLVAASEAKAELIQRDVPYLTVLGPRGGSAIAAAALNGLLRLAARG
jgi:precorrin-8X/cobalt-precorrin-8 methylmutase